ncbi:MAG: response regulator [Alphaproteobacteria bacterium]
MLPSAHAHTTLQRPTHTELFAASAFTEALVERDYRLGPVVLIVEDEPVCRSLLSNILSGHTQERAGFVNEGLTLYAQMVPDVVFLDIDLPDGSGLDALKTIMEHDQMSHVIMITARCTEENVKRALQLGAKGFLAKPFTVARVKECLHRWKDGLIASRKRKVVL